jgi:hypothetical protein
MFFLAPRRVVQGARNTAEPLSVFIHNTLPLESTANYSTAPIRRLLGFRLVAYIRKANCAMHCSKSYNTICLAAYIRKAILSSQCIHRASNMLQVSSHMTTIQSAIWFNLQYISAKQFPSQYIHRTSNTQCKSERPFRLQYIFRVRHRLQYNGILVKAFRLQDNTLRVQYRNPGQVNTVFCIHFRFQYTES